MKLIVKEGVAGRGVFAEEAVPKGSVVLRYVGPVLRYADTTPDTLAVQIAPDKYLGASGQLDDYVNHSCDPNCGLVVGEADAVPPDVYLVSIRDIAAGEELYFDYSTTMDEDDFELPCLCGTAVCRGTVRDFKHLPDGLKRRYATLGVVPAYNLRYVPPA